MGWYSGHKKNAFTKNIFYSTTDNKVDGKKVKEVYSTLSSLCHAWASENVPRGRSGSSMFFEDGIIYSYGRHYEAAKIHTNKKGAKLVLMNSEDYSNSTRNHLSEIRAAVKHIDVLRVPYVDVDKFKTVYKNGAHSERHEANLNYFANIIASHMENIFRMVGYSSELSVLEVYKDIEQYCSFFGLKVPFKLDEVTMATLKACSKEHSRRRAIADKKREEREAAATKELEALHSVKLKELENNFTNVLKAWENGDIDHSGLRMGMEFKVSVKAPFGRTKSKYIHLDISQYEQRITEAFTKMHHESIRAWKAGEISSYSIDENLYLSHELNIDLRSELALLRVKGNLVETSEGADVPLDHALRLLAKIEAGLAKKGERVGNFTLESISDSSKEPVIITIGCHKIDLNEARRVLNPYKMV